MTQAQTCPVCLRATLKKHHASLPRFTHSGFLQISNADFNLLECSHCSSILPDLEEQESTAIKNRYHTADYANQAVEKHMMVSDEYPEPVSSQFIQANIIIENLELSGNISILDIGCNRGSLLLELAKILPEATFTGFDVNTHLPTLPPTDNVDFVLGNLDDVEGQFDLIIFSHSIQLVPDLENLRYNLQRLAKSNAQMFLQVPDSEKKVASLLYGDQYFYFHKQNLASLINSFGYQPEIIDSRYFPNDILCMAQRTDSHVNRYRSVPLSELLNSLEEKKNQLLKLEHGKRIGILGTTVDAAFCAVILGNRVNFFIDEDPNRQNHPFYGRPVTAANKLQESDLLLVPYGKSAENIIKRLGKQYPAKFMAI